MPNENVGKGKMSAAGMLITPMPVTPEEVGLAQSVVQATEPAAATQVTAAQVATGGMTVAEAGRKGGQKVSAERGPEFYATIGRKGGQAVKAERGPEFYKEIGKKGGQRVKAERGSAFYKEIGKKGGAKVRAERGPDYYKEIGKKGGQRIKELLAKGRESEK